MSSKNLKYYKLLKHLVVSSLDQDTYSFEEICRYCKGAFPSDVLETIKQLKLDSKVQFGSEKKRKKDIFQIDASPIDFEWRFTKETATNISKLALTFGDKILCLGAPTIFKELLSAKVDPCLIDRNPFLKDVFPHASEEQLLISDIVKFKKNRPSRLFNVVVMDPPWYLPHTLFWLQIATKFLSSNGVIVIPIFPELVRPSAIEEREYLFSVLKKFGEIQHISQIIYNTPLFEQETLSNLGILGAKNWRATDLFVLKIKNLPFNSVPEPPKEKEWYRFKFGTQIVGITNSNEDNQEITIKSPYKDGSFLLKSVSLRDSTRSKISFWTSRNRVAIITGVERILKFLVFIQQDESYDYALKKVAKNKKEYQALKKLITLIDLNNQAK